MKDLPLTFFYAFDNNDEKRRDSLHEFSESGAENIVISPYFINAVREKSSMRDVFLRELQAEGLRFVDAHSPYGKLLDFNCPDAEQREISFQTHRDAINIASAMVANTITMHVGTNCLYKMCSAEEHMENILRMIERLLPTAEEKKVSICIENGWSPCCSPDSLLYFKKCFDSEYLGFCYDSGHANLMDKGRLFKECNAADCWRFVGVEPEWEYSALEKMLPHSRTCHLHDNDGFSDTHNDLGTGNTDFDHIVSLLHTAPQLQCIQCEVDAVKHNIPVWHLCENFKKYCLKKQS